jgi:hypothetical protein
MAHQVMRRADQLALVEAADFDEVRIHIGNLPFQIRLGNDGTALFHVEFNSRNWQVLSHRNSERSSANMI